ncbi:ankyrin [endosymbiont of Acanthamoeba sp. UWC8]|uniref:ankyrin repeat domain-containing protein n=1 Tax=endosymbiont of Acanthamoeba sp. UWC8 TaxID=86106 RepID=UPI0004D101E1|nr:ankyrin repeat domain-containing protein [endosymbiont of Acanthamoeba sp. UWC8]AIF80932.1 ankyrin [endosymbiont of Acanthamoeba sp. UWC8]
MKNTDIPDYTLLDRNPFISAASEGVESVAHLIAEGKDINKKYSRDRHKTALIYLAGMGKEEEVKCLLENGADADLGDNEGKTPLMFAAQNGCLAIVKYLLEVGANPNIQDINGKTALMYVGKLGIKSQDKDIIKYLTDYEADPEIKDKEGKTALMQAVIEKNVKAIEYFMQQGIRLNNDDKLNDNTKEFFEEFNKYNTTVPSLLRIVLQRFVNGLGGNPNFIDNNIKHNNTTLKELIPYELAIMVDDIIPNVKATEVTYVNPLKSELKSWVDKINFKEKEKFILESEKAGAKSSARINFKDAWDALGL